MTNFESLTWALVDWFDKLLVELPESLRQRVEKDFFPFTWEYLSPTQRRSFALQWDYQNDPVTEQDQQYWFDFLCTQHIILHFF